MESLHFSEEVGDKEVCAVVARGEEEGGSNGG